MNITNTKKNVSFISRLEKNHLKCRAVEVTPYCAARFPILTFSSSVNCTYGPHPFKLAFDALLVSELVSAVFKIAFFTASFAAVILEEGTTLAKGPLGSGKTGLFSLKYCNRDIVITPETLTWLSVTCNKFLFKYFKDKILEVGQKTTKSVKICLGYMVESKKKPKH